MKGVFADTSLTLVYILTWHPGRCTLGRFRVVKCCCVCVCKRLTDHFEKEDGKRELEWNLHHRCILRSILGEKLRIWKLIPFKLSLTEFPLERLHVFQFEDMDYGTKVMSFKTIISAMNCWSSSSSRSQELSSESYIQLCQPSGQETLTLQLHGLTLKDQGRTTLVNISNYNLTILKGTEGRKSHCEEKKECREKDNSVIRRQFGGVVGTEARLSGLEFGLEPESRSGI